LRPKCGRILHVQPLSSPSNIGLRVMSDREPFIFNCRTECGVYVIANLRTDLDGHFTIICPACGHKHYRRVERGNITEDRAAGKCIDEIEPPKSAVFKSQRAAITALGAIAKRGSRSSFFSKLWLRRAQEEQ